MISVNASVCILAAALILLLPMDWLLAAFFAAAFHEAGHLVAIYAAGGRVERIQIGAYGAKIHAHLPENRQEFFCAAAGPLASLSLLLFCHIAPKLAICGLIQGFFNLLPVFPMDGGRMLFCLLQWKLPQRADQISRYIGYFVCGILFFLTLAAFLWRNLGLFPLLCAAAVISRLLSGNIPCKTTGSAVQ